MNDSKEIVNNLKDILKDIPISEKGKALAVYNLQRKWQIEDEKSDKICDDNSDKMNTFVLSINKQSDVIIEGTHQPEPQELENMLEFLNEGEEALLSKPEDITVQHQSQPINNYWLTCLKNKNIEIEEHDEPILEHLRRIIWLESRSDDRNTRKTEQKFFFNPNEYFTNEFLELTAIYENSEPSKSIASKIMWKEGQNVTSQIIVKKQKHKKTGKMRETKKTVPQKSFFANFQNLNVDDIDEEDLEHIAETGDYDESQKLTVFSVIDTVEDIMDMINHGLEYYLDCAAEDSEDDEYNSSDDDEFVDVDEEDIADESPSPGLKKKKGKKVGGGVQDKNSSNQDKKGHDKDGGVSQKGTDSVGEPNKQECEQN